MRKILLTIFSCVLSLYAVAQEGAVQEKKVTGKVTSFEDGSTLPGVNVVVKGTTIGTATDGNGVFSITVPENATLVFSFIGLQTKEVEIGARTTSVDVVLASDISQLNEVVVVGYGTQERKEITGSVTSVSAKDLENLIAPSFDTQLGGRAAGVQVTTPGGVIGQRPIVRIRGVNSLTSSADPLYVIDGVPVVTSDRSSIISTNPLANINPSDIQSYEVLKDGSATAIYGSRAANGVILITTKRGSKGKSSINYSGSVGFSENVDRFDLLNGDQFVTIANEKRSNSGGTALAVAGENTDWQDYIFRKGFVQQHNVSFSGGTETSTYFFSLGYTDQQSSVVKNDMERYSFRANLDQKVGTRLKLGTSLSYTYTQINGLNNGANSLSGAIYNATRSLPNVAIFDPANVEYDGYNTTADGAALGRGNNLANVDNNIPNIAFVLDHNKNRNRNNRVLGSVYADLEIAEGLSARTQIGVDLTLPDDFRSWDPRHGDGRGTTGNVFQAYNPAYRWNWQNTLNYQKSINDVHNFNITAGVEYQKTTFSGFNGSGTGLADRFFLQQNLISNSYINQFSGGSFSERGFESYFGRLNYNYNDKYLVSISARNDAISDLYKDNRSGFFPGASVGWRISQEEFFTSTLISDFKLRASYAELGNVEIGTLPYAGGYSAVLYGPSNGIALTQVTNLPLEWETSKKFNVGLNLTLGRVTFEADYFTTKIDNMVLNAPVAPSLGVPPSNAIAQNVGSMKNSGIELRVSSRVLERGEFSWNTDFNFTLIKNEVTNLINPLSSTYNRTEVGRSIGELYGYRWAGVNEANGNPMYYKADGSIVQYNLSLASANRGWKTYDPNDHANVSTASSLTSGDLAFLGRTLPTWSGGWTNTFSYKHFDLEIFTRYSGGNYIMNETKRLLLGQGFSNNHADILNRWTEAGQNTDIPKVFSGQDANMWQTGNANSRFVQKGDFVRIQNIVLGYRVPSTVLDKISKGNVKSARVIAQVQNPFTFTGYDGLDPELNQYSDQLQYGVDWNAAPIIRTYSLGLNVGF